MMMWCSW